MYKAGDASSQLKKLKSITDGGLEAKPPAVGQFFEKTTILMPLDHILHMFRAI